MNKYSGLFLFASASRWNQWNTANLDNSSHPKKGGEEFLYNMKIS
jgi:hypothetical protein